MPAISTRTASYLLFVGLIVAVCVFRLGPVLLAGLFSYMILDLTYVRVRRFVPRLPAKYLCVAIFVVTAGALAYLFGQFVSLGVRRMPVIIANLLPAIDSLASKFGMELPFENLQELRTILMQTLMDNVRSITATSGILTRGFFHLPKAGSYKSLHRTKFLFKVISVPIKYF